MEEKMIRLTLKTEKSKGNTTTTTEEDAIIRLNARTTLSQILRFEKQAKSIYRKSLKALKDNPYRTRICLSITHWEGEHAENLVSSNHWYNNNHDDYSNEHIVLYANRDNDLMVEETVFLKSNVVESISVVDYH